MTTHAERSGASGPLGPTLGRAGFTLVETVVAIVIAGIVMIAVYQVLVTTQQVSTMHREQVAVQQSLRAGLDILAQELREASANGGDVTLVDDDRVGFRALRSFGVVCAKGVSQLTVATFGAGRFQQGVPIFIFGDGDRTTAADDIWFTADLVDLPVAADCPGSRPAQQLVITGYTSTQFAAVNPGAVVRAFSELEYHLQQVDGEPYLARTVDGETALMVGPLSPADALEFTYFDADGNTTTTAAAVRRVEITIRAASAAMRPGSQTPIAGVLTTSVALRN
jgi:prepilin-type N-terminal cleavage/methylation domain-containing protein